jgi:tripartite-type tricarboxylate transporter receptor subunit TctC
MFLLHPSSFAAISWIGPGRLRTVERLLIPRAARQLANLGALFFWLAASTFSTLAQSYPTRPVHVVVPYAAGASGDLLARVVGSKLAESCAVPVVVENKPGAAGTIGAGLVFKAAPDGYTLLLGTDAQMAISPHIQKGLPYRPEEFTPIVQAAMIEFVLSAHPSIPARTLAELVAHLKAYPGKYSYATPGIGSSAHLAMEWLKSVAGLDIVHVPYRGSSQLLPDVISGVVHLTYTGLPQTMPLVSTGKLKAIAVGSAKRVAAAPGVPTIGETFPGFEANASWNYFGPNGLDRALVMKLNDAINNVLALPEVGGRLGEQGLIPVGGAPELLRDRMRSDFEKWGRVIQQVGLKPE